MVHKKILSSKIRKEFASSTQLKIKHIKKKLVPNNGSTFETCKNACTLGREAYQGGAYIGPKRIPSGATLQYYHL
jgi:hypothetical protein